MPLYDYKCEECDKIQEHYKKIADSTHKCECGGIQNRTLTTQFYAQSDIEPYLDPHIGKEPMWIKSRQHRREVMKSQKVYELVGKGWI